MGGKLAEQLLARQEFGQDFDLLAVEDVFALIFLEAIQEHGAGNRLGMHRRSRTR